MKADNESCKAVKAFFQDQLGVSCAEEAKRICISMFPWILPELAKQDVAIFCRS